MTEFNPLDKMLLREFNVRVFRSEKAETDIVANFVGMDGDDYIVLDPMFALFMMSPSTRDEDDPELGISMVKEDESPVLRFMPYVPMAAQNIRMKFKAEDIEVCMPPRKEIVGGYIRAIIKMRSSVLSSEPKVKLN